MGEGEGRRKQLQLPPQHSHHLEAPSTGLFWSLLPGRIQEVLRAFATPRRGAVGSLLPSGQLGLVSAKGRLSLGNPIPHHSYFDSKGSAYSCCPRSCGNMMTLYDQAPQGPAARAHFPRGPCWDFTLVCLRAPNPAYFRSPDSLFRHAAFLSRRP